MTDEEVREFLEAVAQRDLHLEDISPNEYMFMRFRMKQIAKTARLAYAIAERPEETNLYGALADELQQQQDEDASAVAMLESLFTRTGIADALDAHGEIIRANLKRQHLPDVDVEFIRGCGVTQPEAEITITLEHMRGSKNPRRFSDDDGNTSLTLRYANDRLTAIAKELKVISERMNEQAASPVPAPPPHKKPRKVFTGIGKILTGVVGGTGNALVGLGMIPATGGAATAGVIASAALSVGAIMQGIGDLRGE